MVDQRFARRDADTAEANADRELVDAGNHQQRVQDSATARRDALQQQSQAAEENANDLAEAAAQAAVNRAEAALTRAQQANFFRLFSALHGGYRPSMPGVPGAPACAAPAAVRWRLHVRARDGTTARLRARIPVVDRLGGVVNHRARGVG